MTKDISLVSLLLVVHINIALLLCVVFCLWPNAFFTTAVVLK